MPEVVVRKTVVAEEKIIHEGGPAPDRPQLRGRMTRPVNLPLQISKERMD